MTVTTWNALADQALAGRVLNRDAARAVLAAPDEELLNQLAAAYRVRRHHWGNRVRPLWALRRKCSRTRFPQ